MTRTPAPSPAEAAGFAGLARATWTVARATFTQFYDKGGPLLSAAVAFYTILSMAPLALIAVSMAGIVFGGEAATGELTAVMSRFLGAEGAEASRDLILSVSDREASRNATLVGFGLLVVGASRIFSEMENALNQLWLVRTEFSSWRMGLWVHVSKKLVAFALVFLAGGFLTALVVFSTVSQVMTRRFANLHLEVGWAEAALVRSSSGVLLTLLFAVLYRWLPRATVAWRDAMAGAFAAAFAFTALEWPLSFYLSHQGVESSYGAIGAFVVFLVWVYYSAQIFFLGAQLSRVLAERSGRGIRPDAAALLVHDVPVST